MTMLSGVQGVGAKWKVLLELGAWIVALVGGFLLLPPYLEPGQTEAFTKFGQFLAGSLAGLLLLPLTVWAGTRYVRWWWMLGVALLAASLWTFFHYNALLARDTVPYDTTRVVAGSDTQYKPDAMRHLERMRNAERPPSRAEMVMDFAGRTDLIWPEPVLRSNEDRLLRTYFAALGLFSSFVVILAHVVVTALDTRAADNVAPGRRNDESITSSAASGTALG